MGYERNNIINFDQSGFNYELTVPRTLSTTGERRTYSMIRDTNATTHSFTVLPTLTASGEFLPVCLVILKEINGVFGPVVQTEVIAIQQKLKNICVLASRSGKMQSNHMQVYKDEVLKFVNGKALIIHDGWRGQIRNDLFQEFPEMDRLVIPDGCTDKNQPLDLMVFRQWKLLAKRCFLRVTVDKLHQCDLRSRNGAITLQSLIFNQLCATSFKPMLRHAWKQYFDDIDQGFSTVNDICFKSLPSFCDSNNCFVPSFIRCAHCHRVLCFPCFFMSPHLHVE
jgi:hypothetical protein